MNDIILTPDSKKLIEDLNNYIISTERTEKVLRNRIKQLQDEAFKDNTIVELKNRIEELESQTNYYLTKEEVDKLSEWKKKLDGPFHTKMSILGSPNITFIPTSLGMGVEATYLGEKITLREIG